MKKHFALFVALALVATAGFAGEFVKFDTKMKVKDSYVVVFTDQERGASAVAAELVATHGGKVKRIYNHVFQGAHIEMNEGRARAMANNPHVLRVEEDYLLHVIGDQANPTWGIDRIDERTLPDDNNYHWDFDGTGVTAFVLDTGIRTTHTDFGGRASWGIDCTGEGQSDGHGHGTHVAGTVGSTTYGVAKNVNLVAVKVCTNGGSCPSSATSCGIDYVIQQKNASPGTPMVANMSLGGPFSQTSNNNVANGVASGVFFAVAAGNENTDACSRSPASEPTAYTVGSTTSSDARSSFSNFGTCLDIFAPGSSITSTWNTSNTATNSISGTSMASPHVAGAAALVLDETPGMTPAQVDAELDARATQGELSGIQSGSPNALLYTLGSGAPPPPPPPPPPATCENVLHGADFSSGAGGWTNGNDTCTTGAFVVGSPDATAWQVGGGNPGNAFYTQPNGGGLGTDDVDGGTCEALSPIVAASGDVTISLDYFHGQRDAGDDAADGFTIEVLNNGAVVDTMVSIGDVTNTAAWTSISTTISNAGNVQLRVRATDAAGPGDIVEGGIDNVEICGDAGAPPPPPPPPPPGGGCSYDNDFEGGDTTGWANDGGSTCTTGDYVLGNPTEQVNGGVTTQVGGSASGTSSLFTATNTSAGANDVDGGNCILTKDAISVPATSTLSFNYFHGQRDAGDDASGDFFNVQYRVNGGAWTTVVSNGDSTSNAAWTAASTTVPAGNVELRVQCSDGSGPGDLVECGIDDVSICE